MPEEKTTLADILDRRNESRKYMQLNYWDQFEDVYRATKCLTKPIMVKGKDGKDVEDQTRTNVCMPELSLIVRRKTARLTASPPQINYVTPKGNSDEVAEKLTALAFMQYDRSGEAQEHRRHVLQAQTFGFSQTKLFWDTVEIKRQQRFDRTQLTDRQKFMELSGAGQDEISQAVQELGTERSPDEISQDVAANGSELKAKIDTTKYAGPIVKTVFIGDFYKEPGCLTLNESGWAQENYWESDLWLQKMLAKRFYDEQGQEVPVFDQKACEELLEDGSYTPAQSQQQPYDLKARLRTAALNQTLPLFATKLLPGKRFDIIESHARGEDGRIWITWIGNEKYVLGRMPYPWDLYGKYIYTEFVPLPDLIGAIGDSSPRLLRFLHQMHNVSVGQRQDLVNQLLRRTVFVDKDEDVPDEAIERKLFRVVRVKNLRSFQVQEEPDVPASAWETEAQIMRMMGMAEPSLNNVEAGSELNPDAGKTATTAILQAKSADALTQYELDSLNLYLKELGEKKLWMNQQAQEEPWQIPGKYMTEGLSARYGKEAVTVLDPMEMQEDIQVEPAAMSMLSVDDDIKRNATIQMYQMAVQNPKDWDTNYAAQAVAKTIRGIDPDKAVPPPQPPPPIPPKVSATISVKFELLPADVQNALLGELGLPPSEELQHRDTLDGVKRISEAADAAVNLDSSGEPPPPGTLDAEAPNGPPHPGKANGKSKPTT